MSRYIRSATPSKGKKVEVLETKNEVSNEYRMTVRASAEGIYEVVSIRDRFCSFSVKQFQEKATQKLLVNN